MADATSGSTNVVHKAAVVIDYKDLLGPVDDLQDKIKAAFGYEGLGIIAVTNVPGYLEKRKALLPLARKLAKLPQDDLKSIEHEASHYSVGWSHGKEIFEGKPDYAKGSFYANPLHDKPVDDEELIKKYPAFLEPNVWPSEQLPDLEPAMKDLGQLMVSVGRKLSTFCDSLVAKENPEYPSDRLGKLLQESRMCKARLLYYFPRKEGDPPVPPVPTAGSDADTMAAVSNWCGWHNDHGSLTALCQAMYMDDAEDGKDVPNPDADAGLYIRSRDHEVVKLQLPAGAMAFQIGESAQIHTGGALQATPHCVRAAGNTGIGRATLAVFMEPEWNEPMAPPAGAEVHRVTKGAHGETLPPGVPALASRWNADMDFGEFTDATLKAYY